MNKSIDIADFNAELNFKLQKGIFNNETQALAKQIMENVAKADDEIEAGIIKTIDNETAKNAETSQLKIINTDQAFKILDSLQGEPIPNNINIKEFLDNLETIESKENFIKHLQSKQDAQSRLTYLNLIQPTLEAPDIVLTKGQRQTNIKVFKDNENFYTLLITQEHNKQLVTFMPKTRIEYVENKIKDADLIQIFDSQASNKKMDLQTNYTTKTAKQSFIDSINIQKEVMQEVENKQQVLESKQWKILDSQEAQKRLDTIQAEPMPQQISKADFLNSEFSKTFDNLENTLKHFENSQDTKRAEYIHLIEPTRQRPDFELLSKNKNGEHTNEYIKAFKDADNNLFYILITKQNNETILTGYPTTKIRELKRKFDNADVIKARDSKDFSSAQSNQMAKSLTSKPSIAQDSTKAINSKAEKIKEFDNLSQNLSIIKRENGDFLFTDNKGKEHTLTTQTQKEWLDTFDLKDINDTYIPKHTQEIKEALGNKDLKLQKGSLLKLVSQGRQNYIKEIKEVLDNPEFIIKDSETSYILAKHLKDDDFL